VKIQQIPKHCLCALIRGYQLTLSPFIGNQCRFYPTCSHYAHEAITRHGAWRGSWLAGCRLLKCHPFNQGGFDPVPTTSSGGRATSSATTQNCCESH